MYLPFIIVNNARYIIFKDWKMVIFYTNDLASMPPEWYCLVNNRKDCIDCVHGLAPLPCWTDDSVMQHRMFYAPAPVLGYNLMMNGVDHMDQ